MPGKGTTNATVDDKVQRMSKRALLCIRGPRESLRQVSKRRVVVMFEKIRNGGKICGTCLRYARWKRNSGEMYSRKYRKFQG